MFRTISGSEANILIFISENNTVKEIGSDYSIIDEVNMIDEINIVDKTNIRNF